MSIRSFVTKNTWFVLASAFLIINAYGVYLLQSEHQRPKTVKVELVTPKDGRVESRDSVKWRFSAPMVSCIETGKWTSVGPVTFHPDVKGSFCWTLPNELTFQPAQQWRKCTEFTALFSDDIRSMNLWALGGKMRFTFHTERLNLINAEQMQYYSGEYAHILLEFNASVSRDELRSNLSFTNTADENVDYRIENSSNTDAPTVIIQNAPTNGLSMYLKAGMQSVDGTLGLAETVVKRLAFTDKLYVTSVTAEENHYWRPFEPAVITASFTLPVDHQSAASFVRVSPPVNVTIETWNQWTHAQIRIAGNFEHGRSYAITFMKGLPSVKGACLDGEMTHTVYFRDASPSVEITANGNYMSPRGGMTIPFRTIAVNKCNITIQRIYPNNFVHLALRQTYRDHDCSDPSDCLGSSVAGKEISLKTDRNEIVENTLCLKDLVGDKLGAFYIQIDATNGKDHRSAWHHIVVSDTGLTVKRSACDLMVMATSIRTLDPINGAAIKVFSLENQELLSGITDTNGVVRFSFTTNDLSGFPFVVTAQKGEDITYLALRESEVNLKGAAGESRYLTEGYEAHIFTDRGIYRPGELAHVKAIVRGKDATCPPPFPVNLKIYRPDGKTDRTLKSMLTEFGTAEFAIEWPDFTPMGRHKLELVIPGISNSIGVAGIMVEEFVPPQIRVDVTTDEERCAADSEFEFQVSSQYLFGKPAADLPVEASIEFKPQPFTPSQWPGFQFGDPQKKFGIVRKPIGKKTLSSSGKTVFKAKADAAWQPPAAIKALIIGTVTEAGGRTVTAYSERVIDIYSSYIGIKRPSGMLNVSKFHNFDLVAVTPDGALLNTPSSLMATVDKLTWVTVLKKGEHDSYSYCSERQASRVTSDEVNLVGDKSSFAFKPVSDGEYRLTITDPAAKTSSSLEFHVCADRQTWQERSMEIPDVVELKLDKEKYLVGEIARLVIKAPFTGKALITLESSHVLSHRVLILTNNTAELDIPVDSSFVPNVYCSVSVIKPVVSEKIWGPHRAAGMVSLVVDAPEKRLCVKLTAPDEIRPKRALDLDMEVTDCNGSGVESEVIVAAADEGICSLTQFKTPDPYAFFFAPRLPGVDMYDLYARLMPELDKTIADEASTPGGDEMAGLGRRLNPIKTRRFKPVALWSGTIKTDSNGKARVHFDVPEFSGQLRIMAVAVDKTSFGSAEKAVFVKRQLIVESSLPRFAAPCDMFTMPVRIFNETGADGEIVLKLNCFGPLVCGNGETSVVRHLVMAKASETNMSFSLQATREPGKAICALDVTMGEEHFTDDVKLAIRPTAPMITVAGSGRLAAGKTANVDAPIGWLANTGNTELWLSSLPSVQLGGGLNYLLNYPYGCIEQTTSKSFPLLYLTDLAQELYPGWLNREQVSRFVEAGILRILSMQRSDGSFGTWCGCDTYVWGSIYATHFLVEARKAGYTVSDQQFTAACEFLRQFLSKEGRDKESVSCPYGYYEQSYAACVMALAGKPQHGVIARLREKVSELNHETRINIGAALLVSGQRRDAHDFLDTVPRFDKSKAYRGTGGCLSSNVRDCALTLSTLLDVDPESPEIPSLLERLEACKVNDRWYTTQENAMALLAIGKYCRLLQKNRSPISGSVAWNNGGKCSEFKNEKNFHVPITDLRNNPISIRNTGTGSLYYSWKSEGVPEDGQVKESDSRIKVRRKFLDLDGKTVEPGKLVQGNLYIVQVIIENNTSATVENVVIEDLLPAGLEIENAELKTSQLVTWIKEKQTLNLLHSDIRDDRMIAFAGPISGSKTFFYAVRAVTKGTFALPAISAECMYDPEIRSVNGAGTMTIVNGD